MNMLCAHIMSGSDWVLYVEQVLIVLIVRSAYRQHFMLTAEYNCIFPNHRNGMFTESSKITEFSLAFVLQ